VLSPDEEQIHFDTFFEVSVTHACCSREGQVITIFSVMVVSQGTRDLGIMFLVDFPKYTVESER
jgi:hypothetical protein